MKACKDCGREISKSAKSCPGCGKNLKKGKKLIVFLIIVVIIFGLIIACVSSLGNELNKLTDTEGLILEEGHNGSLDEMGIAYYIEGIIKNDTDKDKGYISVKFNAYDKDGNHLGTCLDNNTNLKSNETWKFKAICMVNKASDIEKYEFVEFSVLNDYIKNTTL